MKKTFSGVIVAMMMNLASATEAPDFGHVYNKKEALTLDYDCLNRGQLLECDFIQTSIRKNLEQGKIEEEREKMKRNYEELQKEFIGEKNCNRYQEIMDVLDGKKESKEEQFSRERGGFEKNEIRKLASRLLENCLEPTKSNFNNLVNVIIDTEARTCNVNSRKFKQIFKKTFTTGATAWITTSEPTGNCGLVIITRFEETQVDKNLSVWKYFSRKVITNPGAKIFDTPCSQFFDEDEVEYDWKDHDHYMQCDIIKFSAI